MGCNYDGNDTKLACQQLGQILYLGDQSTHVCGGGLWGRVILCGPADCKDALYAAGVFIHRFVYGTPKIQKEEKKANPDQWYKADHYG